MPGDKKIEKMNMQFIDTIHFRASPLSYTSNAKTVLP